MRVTYFEPLVLYMVMKVYGFLPAAVRINWYDLETLHTTIQFILFKPSHPFSYKFSKAPMLLYIPMTICTVQNMYILYFPCCLKKIIGIIFSLIRQRKVAKQLIFSIFSFNFPKISHDKNN